MLLDSCLFTGFLFAVRSSGALPSYHSNHSILMLRWTRLCTSHWMRQCEVFQVLFRLLKLHNNICNTMHFRHHGSPSGPPSRLILQQAPDVFVCPFVPVASRWSIPHWMLHCDVCQTHCLTRTPACRSTQCAICFCVLTAWRLCSVSRILIHKCNKDVRPNPSCFPHR